MKDFFFLQNHGEVKLILREIAQKTTNKLQSFWNYEKCWQPSNFQFDERIFPSRRRIKRNPSPNFVIEYLTQNVIFQVKSRVNKYVFWGLLILKSQHPMLPNLTWNETWNYTSLKKSGWLSRFNWPKARYLKGKNSKKEFFCYCLDSCYDPCHV